jgi:hypothetical protein
LAGTVVWVVLLLLVSVHEAALVEAQLRVTVAPLLIEVVTGVSELRTGSAGGGGAAVTVMSKLLLLTVTPPPVQLSL